MKIVNAEKSIVFYVETDEKELNRYTRHSSCSWTVVMGESDEIPELESFNEQKHRLKYIKQGEKSMLAYISEMKYQIFLIK